MANKKIVSFLCNWCTYTAADLAGTSRLQYSDNIRIIKTMCSSRVDPVFVIKALLEGADGVFIGGCHPGDCHYQKGNYYERRKIALTKTLLESIGIKKGRLRLTWISASEGPKFAETMNDFSNKIEKLGENKLSQNIYL
jgi:F420-non-reducing hydrogenase iron-sulfur subunit